MRATLTIDGYDAEADTENIGWLVRYNNDDDNDNGIEDYLELSGTVANEDDLQEVSVDYRLRDDAYAEDFLATFDATNVQTSGRAQTNPRKSSPTTPTSASIKLSELPDTVWVEGIARGGRLAGARRSWASARPQCSFTGVGRKT